MFVQKLRRKIAFRRHVASHFRNGTEILADSFRLKRLLYIAETTDGLRFSLVLATREWFTLFECLIARTYLGAPIELGAGGTIVDVGTNFGAFTVLASRIVGARGRVLAFEPNPATFGRLEQNIRLNGCDNVVAVNAAVGGEDGEIDLYISRNSAQSSTFAGIDGRSNAGHGTARVEVRSLARALGEAGGAEDLLKVDCEGSEYPMFAEVDDVTLAPVSAVCMEIHRIDGGFPYDMGQRLTELGFRAAQGNPLVATRGP